MKERTDTGLFALELFPNHVRSRDREQRRSADTLQTAGTTSSKPDSAIGTGSNKDSPSISKREKVKSFGHDAKIKTKRLLKRQSACQKELMVEKDGSGNLYDDIQENAAFEPAQLMNQKRYDVEAITDRTINAIVSGAKAVVHPRSAAKGKAASKIAVEDKPYLSHEAELEFLEAHDNLDKAKSGNTPSGKTEPTTVEDDESRIRDLEELRQSRKVAWTTTHHIKRVLVVPLREIPAPEKADFYSYDECTGKQRLDWRSWLSALHKHAMQNFANNSMGHIDFASHPPFDRDNMMRQLERLLVASGPWQIWLSSGRQVYRWENPARTRRWFASWFFIWYLDYCGTFCLAYVAFIVLQNKFRPRNIASLRQSHDRSQDHGAAVYKFDELISKHGSDKWLDPIMDELGPKIQSQIMDLASLLETLNNFYEWRLPTRTWATLFWFFCAILLGTFTTTGYCVKIMWMFAILDFFLGFWVASLYPQYRHVVNSLLWIVWDIPDDGEWSMMYLRSKAEETRSRLIRMKVQEKHDQDMDGSGPTAYVGNIELAGDSEENEMNSDCDAASFATAESSTSILGGLDFLSFQCYTRGLRGQLIIYSDGLRFERRGKEQWRHSWNELLEIRKTESDLGAGAALVPDLFKPEGLLLTFADGSKVSLGHVKRRDRAFNCIIGFSGLRFQVLPLAADDKCLSTVMDMKSGHPKQGTLWPKDKASGTG